MSIFNILIDQIISFYTIMKSKKIFYPFHETLFLFATSHTGIKFYMILSHHL
jgi:hypothetical protein